MHDWGHLPATRAQVLAQAAVDDGMRHPALVSMGAIGCKGKYPGNCARDLETVRSPTQLSIAVQEFP
eukprot:9216050-Alexandrium_andersonii.AAC.1